MGLRQKTRDKIWLHLANRTNFRFGNMSGEWTEEHNIGSFGQLPDFLRDQLKAITKDKDVYIVRSYQTPIGWAYDQKWFIPNVHYSVTTNHHQRILRAETR